MLSRRELKEHQPIDPYRNKPRCAPRHLYRALTPNLNYKTKNRLEYTGSSRRHDDIVVNRMYPFLTQHAS